MSRVAVRFPASSVATNNDALDLEASAERYRELLDRALRDALSLCDVVVTVDPHAAGLTIDVDTDDRPLAQRLEREVRDLAWVVRQMGAWAITR